jgi:hypothetical protein
MEPPCFFFILFKIEVKGAELQRFSRLQRELDVVNACIRIDRSSEVASDIALYPCAVTAIEAEKKRVIFFRYCRIRVVTGEEAIAAGQLGFALQQRARTQIECIGALVPAGVEFGNGGLHESRTGQPAEPVDSSPVKLRTKSVAWFAASWRGAIQKLSL